MQNPFDPAQVAGVIKCGNESALPQNFGAVSHKKDFFPRDKILVQITFLE